jgi:hypothetical protein
LLAIGIGLALVGAVRRPAVQAARGIAGPPWRGASEARIIAASVTRTNPMPVFRRSVVVLPAIVLAPWAGLADAQRMFLAHRPVARTEQTSQKAPDGKTAFDTATVIVGVPAERIYETAEKSPHAAAGITTTRDDGPTRRVECTGRTPNAAIQAISLGDRLTQILVSSAHATGPEATTSTIVERFIGVCRKISVECTAGS